MFGPAIGAPLVQHPVIQAAGFTGSTRGGRALFDLACDRPDPIPFHGELGSVNPVVVLPAAANERAGDIATGYLDSLTLGAGQFCTNPGLLFVPAVSTLIAEIAQRVPHCATTPLLTSRIADSFTSFTAWDDLDVVAVSKQPAGTFGVQTEVRQTTLKQFAADIENLTEERFGPAGLLVTYSDIDELKDVLAELPGSLTATVHAEPSEYDVLGALGPILARRAGRLLLNGWPTGVAVAAAQNHGGPWPASTNARDTSVGTHAIDRWLVPVAFQNWPDELLPPELASSNPLGVPRVEQ